MIHTVHKKRTAVAVLVGVALLLSALPALAHNGVDHSLENDETSVTETERLESLVLILQQLVQVLTEYRAQYGAMPSPRPPTVTPVVAAPVPHEDGDEHEHTESQVVADTTTSGEGEELVIELEEHSGRTHVHMRYVDKPEEMFFVDAALTNEDGVVSAIVTRTGVSESEVRAAITYTGAH